MDPNHPAAGNPLLQDKILRDLRREILSSFAPGSRLEAERDLAIRLNVSRGTLRLALKQLEDEGMIVRQQGRGTFVKNIFGDKPRSNRIGMLFFSSMQTLLAEPFYARILKGVRDEVDARSLELMIFANQTDTGRTKSEADLEREDMDQVDGLILFEIFSRAKVDAFSSRKPFVLLDSEFPETNLPCVVMDNAGGAFAATQKLLSLGHREILFIGEKPDKSVTDPAWQARRSGYEEAMLAADMAPRMVFVEQRGSLALAELLTRLLKGPVPPTAVITPAETWALVIVNAAHQCGLKVPDDLSVIGFGAVLGPELETRFISTLSCDLERMGAEAVRLLEQQIAGVSRGDRRRVVPMQLHEAASISPLKS